MAKTKILFISSTAPILGKDGKPVPVPSIETYQAIDQVVKNSKYGKRFEVLKPVFNRPPEFMQEDLANNSPQIVHFFGHGEKGWLYFQNEEGNLEETKLKPFANAFGIINEHYEKNHRGDKISVVVLVACNSDKIAKAVSEYVDCAIGISNEILIDAGIAFSEEFYAHLCEGRDIDFSFKLASNVRELLNLNQKDKPKIFPENRDFSQISFSPQKRQKPKKLSWDKEALALRYVKPDFPNEVYEGNPIRITGTITNAGNVAIPLNSVVIAVRPPGGTVTDGPFTFDFTVKPSCVIGPGKTVSFSEEKAIETKIRNNTPQEIPNRYIDNEWFGFMACQTEDGVWHNDTSKSPFVVKRKNI